MPDDFRWEPTGNVRTVRGGTPGGADTEPRSGPGAHDRPRTRQDTGADNPLGQQLRDLR